MIVYMLSSWLCFLDKWDNVCYGFNSCQPYLHRTQVLKDIWSHVVKVFSLLLIHPVSKLNSSIHFHTAFDWFVWSFSSIINIPCCNSFLLKWLDALQSQACSSVPILRYFLAVVCSGSLENSPRFSPEATKNIVSWLHISSRNWNINICFVIYHLEL